MIKPNMPVNDFKRVSNFTQQTLGMMLPPSKKNMVESRLLKRLKALNIDTYSRYLDYAFNHSPAEKEILIDQITTHETYFFREKKHFDFLLSDILPFYESQGVRQLKLLCAGCSSGEEAYSLAITLEEYKRQSGFVFHYSITAFDVSKPVLDKARTGIYGERSIQGIPQEVLKRYFLMKEVPGKQNLYKIKPEIGRNVTFKPMNLNSASYELTGAFHFISCRNTLIYFDEAKQYQILSKLVRHMSEDGFLMTGHTESVLEPEKVRLQPVIPAVYRKSAREPEKETVS